MNQPENFQAHGSFPQLPFTGRYFREIDSKGRAVVPVSMAREFFGRSKGVVYLVPSPRHPCLEVFAATQYQRMLKHSPRDVDAFPVDALVQWRTNNAMKAKLRVANRITIPEIFVYIFPRDVISFVGCGDHIELWDPERWHEQNRASLEGLF